MEKYADLFSPIRIGECTIPNRFFMAPMGAVGMCDSDGAYTDKAIEYYAERAKGGTGLIITGVSKTDLDVEPFGAPSIALVMKNPGAFVQSGTRLVERCHPYNSKVFLQLGFGFGRAMVPAALAAGAGKIAPSEVTNRWNPSITHRALSTEEVKKIIENTIASAVVAKMCGFDGVEIHAVHEGYLLDQFTLELFNQRTDEYGGSFENRYRPAVEIVKGIKAACGEDFPVTLRFTVKSFIKEVRQGGLPGETFKELGRDTQEGIKAAIHLEKAGYDALNVDCGTYDSWYWNHPPMYFEDGMYLPFAKQVKEAVTIPVMVAGRMDDPDLAIKALHEGEADMIGLGRPLLADSYLPNKIKMNKIESIRPCLSCHDGCLGRLKQAKPISCAVNPSCANEQEFNLTQAVEKKRVLIVGGGVAGLEAARVLKERGHEPVIYEATSFLGGSLIPGGMPPFKKNDHKLIDWYKYEMQRLDIEIHLNSVVTEELIKSDRFDVVFLASGASPIQLQLNGQETNNYFSSIDASMNFNKIGDEVAIIGAGLVGAELGLWYTQNGKKVTIVEMTDQILGGEDNMCFANYDMLKDLLNFNNVEILRETKAKAISSLGLEVETKTGESFTVPANTIISAIGYKSDNELYPIVSKLPKETYIAGDAKNVHNIMYAIWDAFEIARTI